MTQIVDREQMASDQATWRTAVRTGATLQEEMLRAEWEEKGLKKTERASNDRRLKFSNLYILLLQPAGCHSNIGRISHGRSCSKRN